MGRPDNDTGETVGFFRGRAKKSGAKCGAQLKRENLRSGGFRWNVYLV